MWSYNHTYPSYISHHGIKGQKWGVRRYQNEDGTLTAEGKKKYKYKNRPDRKLDKQLSKASQSERVKAAKQSRDKALNRYFDVDFHYSKVANEDMDDTPRVRKAHKDASKAFDEYMKSERDLYNSYLDEINHERTKEGRVYVSKYLERVYEASRKRG